MTTKAEEKAKLKKFNVILVRSFLVCLTILGVAIAALYA